ncbi:hypothetical protein C4D39_15325 [Clostridium perfringens]|uniref:hypothetical protein n=1 Tax=Clostridium perfringens TaxID=1502 RepID=UPI0021482D55|nr:hypothetical protein [Clostridium perfringens]MDM0973046.1 hypothetical protein [Clostridium perfringens]MDU3774054.1 hypothetical protein [Clostridium perfringens]UUR84413.1 hypothetical protein NQ193_02425 [Clostridium perfringens]
MDNDNKLVKLIKKIIKKNKFNYEYRNVKILDSNNGNIKISEILSEGKPVMIARCGATEMRCVSEFLKSDFKGVFSDKIKKEIQELSGVFPATDKILVNFCKEYIRCTSNADILALWGVGAESKVVHNYCKSTEYIHLRSLEPYYFNDPWSKNLEGKKVLVIHPFSESIKKQYQKRKKLFENENILPEFKELICIKAVQSIANEETEFNNWFEALQYMKNEIDNVEFDIAIIGAGAYGLPLAEHIKSLGKISIQMSGATQILFGIKGKRWDEHEFISKLYNDDWVKALGNEKPKNSNKVEGGSYW